MDPNTIQAAQGVSRLGFFGMLSYGFLTLFVLLLVLNTVYIALEQKSITPVLKNLGDALLFGTQHISEISREIITNNGGYIRTADFWSGIGNYIWMYAKLFIYTYSIYGWFLLIMMLLEWGPLYTGGHKFSVFLLAAMIFIMLQSIILLGNAAVTKTIDCFSGCPNSVMYYIGLPVTWIWDLVKAFPLIIKPGIDVSSKIVGNNTVF
jgi:hypothetical protein